MIEESNSFHATKTAAAAGHRIRQDEDNAKAPARKGTRRTRRFREYQCSQDPNALT